MPSLASTALAATSIAAAPTNPGPAAAIAAAARLLLPIWKRLLNESTRVNRLQTDAGERIIGRRVWPARVATALDSDTPTLSADNAFTALKDGKTNRDLSDGLQLRRVRVMGANHIELTGFTDQW